jgi:dienelactone hydrolase
MVLDDYVRRLREIRAERREKLRGLRTVADVQGHRAFAPRPAKCPLEPITTGTIVLDTYRIDRVMFQSRPGVWVTANLYVPNEIAGQAPAVVGTCGHSMDGKAEEAYTGFAQRLVRNGFIVLLYEPFNQGERDQYSRLSERQCVAGCCQAHNMMGKQMELVGDFYGMWRAWDGIRALDFLLTMSEVDPARIGVTGNSGGGTMTTWLWGCEERFAMAAPGCFVTTFLTNLENELPADCEQYPPGVIGEGLEMVDFLIARAPKPVIILGQQYDFFERRGVREAFGELQRIYRLLGAEDDAALFTGPSTHGYKLENQEAMVDFFHRRAAVSGSVAKVEKQDDLNPADLQVTPNGDVLAVGGTPVYELTDQKAAALAATRPVLAGEDLKRAVRGLLHLPDAPSTPPHFRIPRPVGGAGRTYARYAVETERDIRAILCKRLVTREWGHTLDVEEEAHLLLPHTSAEEDMAQEPLVTEFEGAFYGLDVRGLGESMPEPHGNGGFFQPYGMDYMMHGHGLLFGESYLGRRVFDVLRTLDLLKAEGAKTIHLYGRGQGALLAMFVALLRDEVATVTLKNGPQSYREWTQAPLVMWPAANFLRGALKVFDLPDILRELGGRVTVIEPWGPNMQPCG